MFLTLPPAVRWAIAGVLGVVLLACLFLWLSAREEADDKRNQDVGAAVQRQADQAATIENVKEANDARQEMHEAITANGGRSRAVYDQCVRSARTPANCERFLPE